MANNLLAGKKGIIFGALDEQSIAWKVAERCAEEGARITLTNAPVAMRFGKINELGERLNAEVIPADATRVEARLKAFAESGRDDKSDEDNPSARDYGDEEAASSEPVEEEG